MNILVFGSDGFVGRHVMDALSENHVVTGTRRHDTEADFLYADLSKPETIKSALVAVEPDVVINCAGVVENSDAAKQNLEFTKNLMEAVSATKLQIGRVIISGSAAEYGQVAPDDIPVDEDTPLNANQGYGLYKLQETTFAREYGREHNINTIIARIFNPIGIGMHPKFLIPRILEQVQQVKESKRDSIEISRFDALRDYIDVRDVAAAIVSLVNNNPKESAYNIGSGIATSNGELVEQVALQCGLINPKIKETSDVPESLVASQADTSRMMSEFGWKPQFKLEETVKGIVDASR